MSILTLKRLKKKKKKNALKKNEHMFPKGLNGLSIMP